MVHLCLFQIAINFFIRGSRWFWQTFEFPAQNILDSFARQKTKTSPFRHISNCKIYFLIIVICSLLVNDLEIGKHISKNEQSKLWKHIEVWWKFLTTKIFNTDDARHLKWVSRGYAFERPTHLFLLFFRNKQPGSYDVTFGPWQTVTRVYFVKWQNVPLICVSFSNYFFLKRKMFDSYNISNDEKETDSVQISY